MRPYHIISPLVAGWFYARLMAEWARSSAGEHYVDIVGVTGSIPVAPTTYFFSASPTLAGEIPVAATIHFLLAGGVVSRAGGIGGGGAVADGVGLAVVFNNSATLVQADIEAVRGGKIHHAFKGHRPQ